MPKAKRSREERSQSILERYPHIQHINDDKALYRLSQHYLVWLLHHNYSDVTVAGRETQLCVFIDWCGQRQLFYPAQVTKQILDRYQRSLFYRRKANGEAMSFRQQHSQLTTLRVWFRWLMRQDYIASNPASELQSPRLEKRLPQLILSEREVEIILHQPDTTTTLGLRDRAILEVLYSTGIRRLELTNLRIGDVNVDEETLSVRQGKGKKDRFLPLGERAAAWVQKYLYEARGELSCARDEGELFLSHVGTGLSPDTLGPLVRSYIDRVGIKRVGACHLFRHAMATHMLEHGADIRFIQAMLGHAEISTTQIYTQVSVKKLREVHSQTHPAAGLKKKVQEADVEIVTLEESEEMLLDMLVVEGVEESESSDTLSTIPLVTCFAKKNTKQLPS
jgi:integrase/recombinase XerD